LAGAEFVSVVIAADRLDRGDDAVLERVDGGALVLGAEAPTGQGKMNDDGVLGRWRRLLLRPAEERHGRKDNHPVLFRVLTAKRRKLIAADS
jgi:hypothetical protein